MTFLCSILVTGSMQFQGWRMVPTLIPEIRVFTEQAGKCWSVPQTYA